MVNKIIFLFICVALFSQNIFSWPLDIAALKRGEVFGVGPHPYNNKNGRSTWVCFETNRTQLKLKCDDLGINPLEGKKAELQIEFITQGIHHEYGLRHGILDKDCKKIERRIRKMKVSSKEMCLRGVGLLDENAPHRTPTWGWVLDEVKTELGGEDM